MKIVITSKNPVKEKVLKRVTASLFSNDFIEIVSLDLEKGGPEPVSKDEVLKQMYSAISEGKVNVPNAQYYVSMEGSMLDDGTSMNEMAYVVVQDSEGRSFVSSCPSFPVPKVIAQDVRGGSGFAESVDNFFKTTGTKQGGGFVKILTNGLINKEDHYYQSLVIVFSAFINKKWFD
jgi:non-canonical (house-cleaning) NTP pyrophosphatase